MDHWKFPSFFFRAVTLVGAAVHLWAAPSLTANCIYGELVASTPDYPNYDGTDRSAVVSPDGKSYAIPYGDGYAVLDMAGNVLGKLTHPSGEIEAVRFAGNGKVLLGALEDAGASSDKFAVFQNDGTLGPTYPTLDPKDGIASLSFDGKWLFRSSDRTQESFVISDNGSGDARLSWPKHFPGRWNFSSAPDGKHLVLLREAGPGILGAFVDGYGFYLNGALTHPRMGTKVDSKVQWGESDHFGLFQSSINDGTMLPSEIPDKASMVDLLNSFGQRTHADNTQSFSPDGSRFASVENHGIGATSVSTVHLWDPTKGQYVGGFAFPQTRLDRTAFSPNGKLLAVSALEFSFSESGAFQGADTAIHIVRLDGKETVATLKGHDGYTTGLSFSPDGKSVLASTRDGGIRRWQLP